MGSGLRSRADVGLANYAGQGSRWRSCCCKDGPRPMRRGTCGQELSRWGRMGHGARRVGLAGARVGEGEGPARLSCKREQAKNKKKRKKEKEKV